MPPAPTIVVHPCDETSLRGAVDSASAGIIRPVLVGPERKIKDTASKFGLDISGFEIVDAAHSEESAAKGVLPEQPGTVARIRYTPLAPGVSPSTNFALPPACVTATALRLMLCVPLKTSTCTVWPGV